MAPWQRWQQRRHHQPDMQSYIAVGMRVPPKEAYASSTGSAWQCWWDTLHMTSSVGMASWRGPGGARDAVAGVPRSSPYAHRAPCLESSELELGPPLCLKGAIIQCNSRMKTIFNSAQPSLASRLASYAQLSSKRRSRRILNKSLPVTDIF